MVSTYKQKLKFHRKYSNQYYLEKFLMEILKLRSLKTDV